MIDRQMIVLGKDFPNYKDAIHYGGNLLYKSGYVKDTYTDSVLEREEEFPTGIPTDPVPMAIPHTGSEHVNKSMFCLVVFNHPVMFHQMGSADEMIPAEMMMMLAIDGSESHLEFLSGVMGIFSEGSVMKRIKQATSVEMVCEVLGEFDLFNEE